MNFEKLLTPKDVCELLNIKMSKLRLMVFRDEIPVHRIGRLLRFSEKELVKWLSEKR